MPAATHQKMETVTRINGDELQAPATSKRRRTQAPATSKRRRTQEAVKREVAEEAAKRGVAEESVAAPDEGQPRRRAVVFDLDETTGTWALGSLVYKMCLKFTQKAPPVDVFVRYYLECGGARPWLRRLLKTLEEWKRLERIDEVCIFTAASNTDGWVTYLKECMEAYAHTPDLFETVIARENSPLIVTASGVRTVKDLSLISRDAQDVALIDDKPENALNGYVIGVPEYTPDVCITELKAWMKAAIPNFADEIESIFAEDAAAHPPNSNDFSGDDALWAAAQELNRIFPEIVIPPPPNSFTKTSTDDKAFKFDPMHIDPPEGENPEMPRH